MVRNKMMKGLLALVLCLSLAVPVKATEVDDAKKKADTLQNQKNSAEKEKNSLVTQLENKVKEMEEVQQKISDKETEIKEKEDELVTAKVNENTQYTSMKKRIKFMYENGNTQLVEILINAESIGDFLNKAEYISTISSYDREMLIKYQEVIKEVEDQETALQAEYEELDEMQDDIVAKQEELTTLVNDKSKEIASLDSELTTTNAKIKELEEAAAEAQRKQQEAAAAAAAAAAQSSSSSSGTTYVASDSVVVSGSGQFANPCPSGTVSSTFGYRDFDSSFHKGLDLAASEGSPTYAADAGTVIIAGWSDSAGNWVVIDHGNGIVTKYMHHSALAVSAGETVVKGQQIGYVGNTGDSFGAHLHFQVEVDGTAVDPQGYL